MALRRWERCQVYQNVLYYGGILKQIKGMEQSPMAPLLSVDRGYFPRATSRCPMRRGLAAKKHLQYR